jgi:hypothetical protein
MRISFSPGRSSRGDDICSILGYWVLQWYWKVRDMSGNATHLRWKIENLVFCSARFDLAEHRKWKWKSLNESATAKPVSFPRRKNDCRFHCEAMGSRGINNKIDEANLLQTHIGAPFWLEAGHWQQSTSLDQRNNQFIHCEEYFLRAAEMCCGDEITRD